MSQVFLSFEYAGFWKRFLAHLVDSFFIIMVFSVLLITFAADEDMAVNVSLKYFLIMTAWKPLIIVFIIAWLYYAIMESSLRQGTFGKRILGMRVTDLQGNRISFAKATARFFAKIISRSILYLGFLFTPFNNKKQALHDIIAGCLVLNDQLKLPPNTPSFNKIYNNYKEK